MIDLPRIALSVRQPWAWAIINAGKDVENRSAGAVRHMTTGRIAIHAAKGMTREEYESARDFMIASIGVVCPAPHLLERGGLVGSVDVFDIVKQSASPWFFGPCGLLLRNAAACSFVPAKGALGYFKWEAADASIVPPPARWMLPAKPVLPLLF